jgi:hypothetical protein
MEPSECFLHSVSVDQKSYRDAQDENPNIHVDNLSHADPLAPDDNAADWRRHPGGMPFALRI